MSNQERSHAEWTSPNFRLLQWDIFCAVVDNFGDIGTCWRLARQLAHVHGVAVRLFVNDLDTFARMCPAVSTDLFQQYVDSIEILSWTSEFSHVDVADVVIEAFGCHIPEIYMAAMAVREVAPVWINLEYLSAENWVEECHLLRSPHPRYRLTRHFFFPGFTAQTGGLIQERGLKDARDAFDTQAATKFWGKLGIDDLAESPSPNFAETVEKPSEFDPTPVIHSDLGLRDELRISLFCYDNAALLDLLRCWANGPDPVRVFAAPGAATIQISEYFGQRIVAGMQFEKQSLTVNALPFLSQFDYDRLLWACDVNFVRGEDSFVRAQWARNPFIWQIYPQTENAHFDKLEAFLRKFLRQSHHSDVVRHCWHAWNGHGNMTEAWKEFVAIRRSLELEGKVWASQLDQAGNLANNLVCFVRSQ